MRAVNTSTYPSSTPPDTRARRSVRIIGDELHDLDPEPAERDTLHLEPASPIGHTTWIRTTLALTALSQVPDVLVDAATTTKILLMGTHLVAAAIVIPAVARRLRA